MSELDTYPVADLPRRYGFSKSSLYEWMDKLGIKPEKIGRIAYLSGSQMERLDAWMEAKRQGLSIEQYLTPPIGNSDDSSGKVESSELGVGNAQSLHSIFSTLANLLTPRPDPLAHLKLLEEAARNQWHLSTSEVKRIAHIKPHHNMRRWGFTFERVGKNGRESAWLISKVKDPLDL